jgi:hypothetical protein
MKRGAEAIATRAQADIDANTVEKPTVLSKIPYEQAKQEYREAIAVQERLKGEASQRKERERERGEIQETLGDRPNVEAATLHLEQREAIAEGRKDQVEQLEDEISALKLRLVEAQGIANQAIASVEEAKAALGKTQKLAELWDRRKAILDSIITGATDKDVEIAVNEAERASREVERARQTETYTRACQLVREAQERRENALQAATRYEKLATGVTGRLGLLLSEAGLENLTVDEDRLCVVSLDGSLEGFYRLSFGERCAIAFKLLLQQKVSHNILAIPWQFVASLSPENREEFNRQVAAHGLFVLTERPASGDLRVEHLNGDVAPQVEEEQPKRKRKAVVK